MALSEEKVRLYIHKLLLSRMRLMCTHGFYGLLLMHMRFGVDEEVDTAYTDGERIVFGTEFLQKLSEDELDFVMLHEIMHVVLEHCYRTGDRDNTLFNVACDIVVNSNILLENDGKLKSITLKEFGEAMHLAPDKKEGHNYTAEQVYEMLHKDAKKKSNSTNNNKNQNTKNNNNPNNSQNSNQSSSSDNSPQGSSGTNSNSADKGKSSNSQNGNSAQNGANETWDDHSKWGTAGEDGDILRDVWINRIKNAAAAIEVRDPDNKRGTLPLLAERLLKELKKPKTDWRTVLNEFIQEEIVDYSFSPPDRRFGDCPFFLPDFNETDEQVKNVLFMIDTSGSMSDEMITEAYSEVKGAIEQFGGKLSGWLGFFDASVVPPKPFENEEEFRIIKPKGGGGTSFEVIFEYVDNEMDDDNKPVSIIILTDGYAPFPNEGAANGIPVLWMINNEAVTPPWGKISRII